ERVLRLSEGQRFMRLPASVWQRFYEDLHVADKLDPDGRLSFTCKQSGRKLWFEAPTVEESLPPGSKVTGFYRPDGSAIHLFDNTGRHLLTWPAVKPNRRADAAAKQVD